MILTDLSTPQLLDVLTHSRAIYPSAHAIGDVVRVIRPDEIHAQHREEQARGLISTEQYADFDGSVVGILFEAGKVFYWVNRLVGLPDSNDPGNETKLVDSAFVYGPEWGTVPEPETEPSPA